MCKKESFLPHVIGFVSTESGQPICGNGMVEAGEDCDCGYSDQCKDTCCYSANEEEGKRCKLRPGKLCRLDIFLWFINIKVLNIVTYTT